MPKKVWVGIEDPDPTVDRKGIKFLQDSGITVEMFDRDLQDEIIEANKEFIEQAKERATEAERAPKTVKLSRLEDAHDTAEFADLAPNALELYRDRSSIQDAVDSESFARRLSKHGILKKRGDELVPTGIGLVLFGSSPRSMLPQAGLLGTIRYADGKQEAFEFDGPLVLVPEQVEKWLRDKLPNVIDRNQMQRKELPALPFELVREAVVNALVHRDYDIAGAKCQLVVTPETIVVRSPGSPVAPITLKQLQDFNAPMLSRNPTIHYVFSKVGLAEERGLGLRSLKEVPSNAGLPLPNYKFEDPYITLTLYRNTGSAARALPTQVSLSAEEKEGWNFVASVGSVNTPEYAKHFGFDDRKALRHLKQFIAAGLLRKVGAGRATRYEII